MKKSLSTMFLLTLWLSVIAIFSCEAQSAVTYQLYDSAGNQISEVTFTNVAPGSSTTITCKMSSTERTTVYPQWSVANLRNGAVIIGYWNGPEQWNMSMGRLWNSWDTVTLKWTLTVPAEGESVSNLPIIISFTQPPSPSPTLTATVSPTQTANTKIVVKVGDWIEYNVTKLRTQEGEALSSYLLKAEIESITGQSVTFAEKATYPDGHIELSTHTSALSEPSIEGFLFPAGMKTGDVVAVFFEEKRLGRVSDVEDFTYDLCEEPRTIVAIENSIGVDKETGVLLSKTSNGQTFSAVRTNLWGSNSNIVVFGAPYDTMLIVGIIAVALIVTLLCTVLLQKRKTKS